MQRDQAISAIEQYFDSGAFRKELEGLVRHRTESVLPGCGPALMAYLEDSMIPMLQAMGFECSIYPNPKSGAGPFLVAKRHEADDLPTVMTYGHGDVVPGFDDRWRDNLSPWQITELDGRWYGRGTADNKGQHCINLAAMRAVLETRGSLGFNTCLLIEMGEECGSPGLRSFCRDNSALFGADVFIASDGPRIHPDAATVFMGSRGTFNFTMKLELREGGHHSGNWGGLLANPAVIMANALATMIDDRGRITVEGWKAEPMTDSVRSAIAKLTVGGGENMPEIDPDWGEPGMTPAERVFASNTFEIRAFEAGNPASPANAIPPSATVWGHMRYVVGTMPEDLLPALRRHLDSHGYQAITLHEERDPMYATRLDPAHPWAQWAIASLEKTAEREISVIPNLGGALPNDVFADILGLPTIWVPHSYAGCSQHAPDEHILPQLSRDALRLMTGLWWDLGAGATPYQG